MRSAIIATIGAIITLVNMLLSERAFCHFTAGCMAHLQAARAPIGFMRLQEEPYLSSAWSCAMTMPVAAQNPIKPISAGLR